MLLQVSFLPLLHLELFGMDIGHIGSRGGGCGTGKDLFSVVIDPETQADQDPAVVFTLGHSDIFVGTLLNIFAVQGQNPSAPGTGGMNGGFTCECFFDSVKNFSIAVKEQGEDIIFLRKIVNGGADKSYGIQVARLAGLPEDILARAKEIVELLSLNDINSHERSEMI